MSVGKSATGMDVGLLTSRDHPRRFHLVQLDSGFQIYSARRVVVTPRAARALMARCAEISFGRSSRTLTVCAHVVKISLHILVVA